MLLLIDNYDSFTFNLWQLLASLGADVRVERNDALSVDAMLALAPSHVVISPGPGAPGNAGVSVAMALRARCPLLGVCLGHQAIAEAFGAAVAHAPKPVHGHPAAITHDANGIFTGVSQGFLATRYHSLAVVERSLPREIVVTARSEDGVVMALRHQDRPLVGVQFHPESVLSVEGPALVKNFLEGRLLPTAAAHGVSPCEQFLPAIILRISSRAVGEGPLGSGLWLSVLSRCSH